MEEEKKQRKKQKEKERIEKMKKEGTYLTKKEKQDKARALQMLEQMKAAGSYHYVPSNVFPNSSLFYVSSTSLYFMIHSVSCIEYVM